MPPLRVIFSSHKSGIGSGAERCLSELVVTLRADGAIDPVVVVPAAGDLSKLLSSQGIRTVQLPNPYWADRFSDATNARASMTRAATRTRRLIGISRIAHQWQAMLRSERPDVAVTNTALTPCLAMASRRQRVPHVWWVHEFVTRHFEMTYFAGERWSQRLMAHWSDSVVVNSSAVADHYSPPIPTTKLRVISPGVEPVQVSPATFDGRGLRLLLLGHQTPEKGSELAIRALARIASEHPVDLRLVGPCDPAYRDHLLRLVGELDLRDHVAIHPFSPTPEEHLEWANVVLTCSTDEAFGRVTVEALKCGRPIIGSSTGGTIELVADHVNGLLVPVGDVEALSRAIAALASDPAFAQMLADNAKAGTTGRFTLRDQADRFIEVLTSCARAT